jgi:protoporphyrin/coproporphyrin ferrochelatase
LGTPNSFKRKDVFSFLNEFLTDPRVLVYPWIQRQFLARILISPLRSKPSSLSYQKIWTNEGSPLMVYSQSVKEKLSALLKEHFIVELAMRYQNPSIRKALDTLRGQNLQKLIILPLFPQYASATTGSIFEKVIGEIKTWNTFPHLTLIDRFYDHPSFIDSFCKIALSYNLSSYDHFLFSFHGLPLKQLLASCPNHPQPHCTCYAAQCHATAEAMIQKLNLPKENCTISFQSRLGKALWITPYTQEVISDLARSGKKNVLVFCPAFVCDCLETLYEIGVEYAEEFKKMGGERLDLCRGLNDDPHWVSSLKEIIFDLSSCKNEE